MKPSYLVPNSTQVPDVILDRWMARLTGAELKVVLYVARRTFGFRREADAISLAQMANGITTRDGRRLDCGTGLNKDTIAKTVQALVDKDILVRTRRADERGGDAPSTYSLNLNSHFGLEGGDELPLPRVGKSDTPPIGEPDTPVSDFPTPPRIEDPTPPVSGFPTHNIQSGQTVRHTDNNNSLSERVSDPVVVQKKDKKSSAPSHSESAPTGTDETGAAGRSKEQIETLAAQMVARANGMSLATAHRLIRDHGPTVCQRQLDLLPYRHARNPARILQVSIKENWQPDFTQTQAEEESQRKRLREERTALQMARLQEQRISAQQDTAELESIWNSLTPSQKAEIEELQWERAIVTAPPPLRARIEAAAKAATPPRAMVASALKRARDAILLKYS